MSPQRPRFTNLIPDGRGIRREEVGINQAEAFRVRGRRVDMHKDNIAHAYYLITAPAAVAATANVWVRVGGTTMLEDGHNFELVSNNELRFTGTVLRHCWCLVNGSITTSTNTTTVGMALAVNDEVHTLTRNSGFIRTGSDISAIGSSGVIELNWNDKVSIWCVADANCNITVQTMTVMVVSYDQIVMEF